MATSGYSNRESVAIPELAPVAAPQAQSTVSGQTGAAGFVGGNTAGGIQIVDPAAGARNVQSTLLDQILAPKIKQEQQNLMWQGYTAARMGADINQIAQSNSPLTSIFGPSGFVQGAQFYNAEKSAALLATRMKESEEQLAQAGPEGVGQLLNTHYDSVKTGDEGTDALIQQQIIQQTGPVMQGIAAKSYALAQSQALMAFTGNAGQQAHNYDAGMKDDTLTPESKAQLQANFLESLQQPPGMDTSAYMSTLSRMVKSQAEQNNFHSVSALLKAGATAGMPEDQAARLMDYIDGKKKEGQANYRASRMAEISAITAEMKAGRIDATGYAAKMKSLDADFQKQTGITDMPLIPYTEVEGGMVSAQGDWYKAQDAAAKAALSAGNTEAQITHISSLIDSGSVGEAGRWSLPKTAVDEAFIQRYQAASPADKVTMMVNNFVGTKYVNDPIKNQLNSGLRAAEGKEYTPLVDAAYMQYKALTSTKDGMMAASAYYSTADMNKLAKFDSYVNMGLDKQVAFQKTFSVEALQNIDFAKPTKADAEIVSAVKGAYADNSWFSSNNAKGMEGLRPESLQLLGSMVKADVSSIAAETGTSTAQAAQMALSRLQASGKLETYGGFAWQKSANQQPLDHYVGSMPPQALDQAFKAVVQDKLKAANFGDLSSAQIYRVQDANGEAHFSIVANKPEGGVNRPLLVSSSELVSKFDSDVKGKLATRGNNNVILNTPADPLSVFNPLQ